MSNKYKAKSCISHGRSFASKGERDCYELLLLREKAKEIKILACQDTVYLTEAKIAYIADFKIEDLKTGETLWVEYKGFETDVWRIKRRLWKYYGPGKLQVWKGSALRMYMTEEIVPISPVVF